MNAPAAIREKQILTTKSADHPIPKVRQPEFNLADDIPRYWWGNHAVKTLLLSAMSATFPPGEKFFIDSVRNYKDQIHDPELKKAVRAFIGQEAHHSKEHNILNSFLEKRGIRIARFEREVQNLMDYFRKNFSHERQLAHTVAVEHFTALMAEELILKYDILEEMDPRIAPLWAWHAIEESEHKAVAFDVYKSVGGSEFVRLTEMMMVSILFPLFTTIHVAKLMKDEGKLGDLKLWGDTLNYMVGKPGVLRKLLPHYFSYYSPKFHPWNYNPSQLVEKAKKKWLGEWA